MAPGEVPALPTLPALRAAGLPEAWRGAACWKVLDTDFGDGAHCIATWALWEADPARPRLLHYVGITPRAPALQPLLERMGACPVLAPHRQALARQWFGLHAGFHRLVLGTLQLRLTLCVGPVVPMLRELQFVADSIYLAGTALCEDRWQAKALARLCRPQTRIALRPADLTQATRGALRQMGIRDAVAPPPHPEVGAPPWQALVYDPPWTLPTTRHAWRQPPRPPSSCVVVGAGLAGAAVAASLALRGWQVTVVDAGPHPAAGASALPAGLMVAPVSRDDAPRSRLARAGIRLTREACHRSLVDGIDWSPCGALELSPSDVDAGTPDDPAQGLPAQWRMEARDWTHPAGDGDTPPAVQALSNPGGLWHGHAAWIRPGTLVDALMAQPGIRFVGDCRVEQLQHDGHQWLAQDAQGRVRAQGALLVLCAARHSVALASQITPSAMPASRARLAAMQVVGGSLSGGIHEDGDDAAFPPFAVQGAGHFSSHIPLDGRRSWWTGATFSPRSTDAALEPEEQQAAHAFNFARLQQLLPDVALRLQSRFAHGEVQAWSGLRCATVDRLPAVGPLDVGAHPRLWISTGMGARGLSYALLCAELLAAELGAEPLPVEASLARALRATRPRLLAGATHHPGSATP